MVWLMLAEFSFTITYLSSERMEYQVMADDVMYEVCEGREMPNLARSLLQ